MFKKIKMIKYILAFTLLVLSTLTVLYFFNLSSEIKRHAISETLLINKIDSTDFIEVENVKSEINKIVTLNAISWEYDKTEIIVNKGDNLTIKVNNIDVMHGIAIPDMQIVGDNYINVDTSKAGEYKFICATYCGLNHDDMFGKVIIS